MSEYFEVQEGDANRVVNAELAAKMPMLDRWARRQVHSLLSGLCNGTVVLIDTLGQACFGPADGESGLCTQVEVTDLRFYRRLVLGGTIGAAEAYMAGWWRCTDLTALVRILTRNRDVQDKVESGLAKLYFAVCGVLHLLRSNTIRGSKKNIGAHYDLGNEFFRLFLDDSMMYSSAYFPSESSSLEEASAEKNDRLCRKLALGSNDHLLEIGTGWGGFALHAASKYGCQVTTTTISKEQYAFATARIAAAGLADRVTVLDQDYRLLRGEYDKIVSIEMIEAVGHRFIPVFFEKCSQLLKPSGTMALQAITIADQEYDRYRKSVDFINRYIFPGGCLPSVTAICAALTRRTDLRLTDLEDMTPHYARTLAEWRRRFLDRLDEVRRLGFDDRFLRMWEFYLCYCEGGFREQAIGSVQMVLRKPQRFGAR